MKRETTIHVHKEPEPFAMVSKSVLNDPNLTWKAKGLLAYLIGKPADWKVCIGDLVNRSSDGRTAIRSGLQELKSLGYAFLESIRESGKIVEWRWHVADKPIFFAKNAHNSPESGFPLVENPLVGKPLVGNRTLPITIIPKRNSTNNNTTKSAADAAGGDGSASGAFLGSSGASLLNCWCLYYQSWFGINYLVKQRTDASQANNILKLLKCRPKDIMAYAFRMWQNTIEFDEIKKEGHDPFFYQIKASRHFNFFLSHLAEIAVEQNHPLDCNLEINDEDYKKLEAVISEGRPD